MKILPKIVLGLIIVFVLLRFIGLDKVPPSLSNDEISIAYDAYSISKTLRDEHGHFLPLSFQSNNTFKAPLTIYLTVPFVMGLGNNEYAVRLPSAILGSLTILVLGLLVFELTKNKNLSLISALMLAVSPGHIYNSRMALESNVALFFTTLGILLTFRALRFVGKKRLVNLLGGALAFGLSVYSYHTQWIFIPLILLTVFVLYFKQIKKEWMLYFGAGVLLLVISPIIFDSLNNLSTNARANTENILKDPGVTFYLENSNNLLVKIQVVLSVFLNKYSEYTNLGYIFFGGLKLFPESYPYQTGLFLFPGIVFFILGIFKLKQYFPIHFKFVISWLLLCPVVAALTVGELNNPRNLVMLIPISIVTGVGLIFGGENFKNKKVYLGGVFILFLVSTFYFLTSYFYHFPKNQAINFQYGYKQIAEYVAEHGDEYDKILVDRRFGPTVHYFAGVPHLYIGYFAKLDPELLLKRKDTPTALYFDKFEMKDIDWNMETPTQRYLYIVPPPNQPKRPEEMNLVKQILYPNREPAFNLYTVK